MAGQERLAGAGAGPSHRVYRTIGPYRRRVRAVMIAIALNR